MNSGQRSRIGFIGSIVTHIFILLFVSFVGLFNLSHPPANDIVEVSLFGGGGGGGGYGISIIAPEVALLEGSKIAADGGKGEDGDIYNTKAAGGGGGGGVVKIICDTITNSGNISVAGGIAGAKSYHYQIAAANGEAGRITIKQLGAL